MDAPSLSRGRLAGSCAAVAHAFACVGDRVAVHYGQSVTHAEHVAASLPGQGHTIVGADLTDAAAVRRMVNVAADRLGSSTSRRGERFAANQRIPRTAPARPRSVPSGSPWHGRGPRGSGRRRRFPCLSERGDGERLRARHQRRLLLAHVIHRRRWASGVATEAMLASRCATLTGSDSEGNPRARPSSERPLAAKAA
jgi:hypothetical protein